jgi:hypothetical protein
MNQCMVAATGVADRFGERDHRRVRSKPSRPELADHPFGDSFPGRQSWIESGKSPQFTRCRAATPCREIPDPLEVFQPCLNFQVHAVSRIFQFARLPVRPFRAAGYPARRSRKAPVWPSGSLDRRPE